MGNGTPTAITGSFSYAWAVTVAAVGSYLLCPVANVQALQLRVLLGILCALMIANLVSRWGVVRITSGNVAFVVSTAVGIAGVVANEIGHWLWP